MKHIITLLIFVLFLTSCGVSDYNRLLEAGMAKHSKQAFQKLAEDKSKYYIQHPKQLKADIGYLKEFIQNIGMNWGKNNILLPKKKEYVKYLQEYKSRAIINFEKGNVRVETLVNKKSLQQSIVMTLLMPENPQNVDLFGTKNITIGGTPYLYGEVKDNTNKNIRYEWRANQYAKYLLKHNYKASSIVRDGKKITIHYVEFPMVRDHVDVRVAKFQPYVKMYARKFHVSETLVYAIMKTESDFNQFAVSGSGAYGLMQIIPTTAGRDAYLKVKGRKGTPSKGYLFNAKNNIELGVAYLNILDKSYLKGIVNPNSREYCVISAYNTGSGNVLKTFHTNKSKAKEEINSLSSSKVYAKLRAKLPYEETRNYLKKVTTAKKEFIYLQKNKL